jgi:cell fate (sporulation/competence/biofilm development) regulator YlbF (YheA/YmcA/DUF963 family)
MDDVVKKAADLAAAIRANRRFTALREIEKVIAGDEDTQKLLQAFEAIQVKMVEKEKSQEPIEVDEKRELARVEEEVKTNASVLELLRVQADYYEMMNLVNSTIQSGLGEGEES